MLVVYDVRTPRHSKLQMMQCSHRLLAEVNGVRAGKVLLCALLAQGHRQRMQQVSVSCVKIDCILLFEDNIISFVVFCLHELLISAETKIVRHFVSRLA